MPKNANHFVRALLEMTEWPEDAWYGIRENLDVNLFTDDDGECHMTFYKVVDGVINSGEYVNVF